MTTGSTEDRLETWESFLKVHKQVSDTLARELQESRDLPLSWYEVLLQLSRERGGRLRLQELAERVFYSRSGLTRLIDRMEAAGMVEREPCPDDRRGMFAVLTPLGRRTLRRAIPTHVQGVESHMFSKLTESEAATLRQILDKVLSNGS